MNLLVFILLLAAWENCLALQTTDRLRPLRRWLHKREVNNNPGVNNRFDRSRRQSYSPTHLTVRPSTNKQSSETDTRGGTAKVTIVNATGPIQPSKTYTYPFGRERTLYVNGAPDNNSQTYVSGSSSSIAQRLVSVDGSSRDARRQSSNQQGGISYEDEIRKREEDRKHREELLRRQQELHQERLKQREEEEAVRREEEEQRRLREHENRRRQEAERRRRQELRRIEEEKRKQQEEERRRIDEERRQQTSRGSDNAGSESRQAYEERRRVEEERRRQGGEEQRRIDEDREEQRRIDEVREEQRRIDEVREEERRRRYQQQQRRRQQVSPQTTNQYYGYQTPRPTPGDPWQRRGGSGGSGSTSYPGTQNFPSGIAQGWDQQTGYRYGDPRVVVSGSRGFGTQYENSQVNDYEDDKSECPDVGVEMRINGLDCQNAIRTFGSYLCYSHEFTSKQCCQICKQLKQTAKVDCEYGDHVDNCKILTPSDCYDLRNRYSCCATCERFKKPFAPAGCEYGDNVDRCDSVRQNPGLCYVPNNHRSCCETCNQIKNTSNPSCAYGDYIPSLCQTYDSSSSGVGVNCYSPHRRKICCLTCERIREWASIGMPADCQYGDRPISFYYPQYGKLTCSNMFQFIDVNECRTNPVVATNCCYTCNRYINTRG